MTNQTISLLSGPKISLQFLPKENEPFHIQLTKSPTFSFSFLVELPSELIQNLLNWQKAYSLKKPLPTLNLPGQNLPTFTKNVLRTLEAIPFGKTLSYGEIARLSGSPKASRAVGTICRLNKWPLFIPCHRVLPKSGELGGYAFGQPIKRALLEFEGVT